MGAFGTGALIAGIGGQTFMQAQAAKDQAAMEGALFDMNRRNADIMAEDAIERGEKGAQDHRRKTKRLIGAQRAALAAQGIDVNYGSAAGIQSETQALGERDALTIRNNAWREAFGFRSQADSLRLQSEFSKSAAKSARTNTLVTGGLRILEVGRSAYGGGAKTPKTTKKGGG